MKRIFEKVMLGRLELKNRLIRSATWEALADDAGNMDERIYTVYEELAAGGTGAIISGFTSVADNDHYLEKTARLSNDGLIAQHKRLTDIVHKYGCPVIAQLAMGEYNSDNCRDMEIDAMTQNDIDTVESLFIDAAVRAGNAGYDGVQIHAAHNFFLSRFISPVHNHRSDGYGGNAENRGRIIVEILHGIREKLPDLHVTMKINSNDFIHEGLTPQDSLAICRLCADSGMDSIEVSGNRTSMPGIHAGQNEAYFKDHALQLADSVNIPVILVGGHRSIANMEKVLNEGRIEFLSLSRPLIREPGLPERWQTGNAAPAQCVSCNMCYRTTGHRCIFNG